LTSAARDAIVAAFTITHPRPRSLRMRSLYLAALATASVVLPGCATGNSGAEGDPRIALVPVVEGLDRPVHLSAPDGDERLVVVEAAGRSRVVS
jgi:hypothetical protein